MGGDRSINLHGRPLAILPASLPRAAAAALLGLLTAAALMVVARRLAGALANPLEPATLLTTGLLIAAAAASIRLGWLFWPAAPVKNSNLRRTPPHCNEGAFSSGVDSPEANHPAPRLDRAVMVLTSLAVAALGFGLCLPDTPAVGKFLLGALLAAEESWAWAWYIRHCIPLPVPRPSSPTPTSRRVLPLNSDAAVLPEDVTQQLSRSQAADGTEELSGWLRMGFAAGQRTGSIHVAFCPPFAATPELEVEPFDGPEARIKTAQLLPYGVRLDLKLAAAADEPTSVVLQFSARTSRVKA